MARSREEYLKAKREGMARLRAKDPDAAREKQKAWNERNRDHVRTKNREYYTRRYFWARMTKLRGPERASHVELARLWRSQRGLCALTGRRLGREAELDHILPKARGGKDDIGNLRWVCSEVNMAKRDLTDDEFNALCGDVMRWIGRRIDLVNSIVTENQEAA